MKDLRNYEEAYQDLRRQNMTKLNFTQWMERMLRRNFLLRKKEFDERRIKLKYH